MPVEGSRNDASRSGVTTTDCVTTAGARVISTVVTVTVRRDASNPRAVTSMSAGRTTSGIENLPFVSATPTLGFCADITVTRAPAMGTPSELLTVPASVAGCACAAATANRDRISVYRTRRT